MSINFPKIFFFFLLSSVCTLFCLLQSLPTISQYYVENGGEVITRRSIAVDEARLPSILICNRLPYSQTALSAYGKSMHQDALRSYLREWFDPSSMDSPDFEEMDEDDQRFAERTVAQLLPNTGLKQRLEQILLKCQDFLSSCVIQGISMSGFNCCENVQPFLATVNGICWIFSNRTFIQESFDSRFSIQLTLQIARNSYVSSSLTTHPGVSIYLVAGDESRANIATDLSAPIINLKDKRHTAVSVRKQIESNRRRKDCESQSWYESSGIVNNLQNFTATGTLTTCLIEAAVRECACVPLIAVLWTLQGDLEASFLRRFDISSICTADEYNRCVRKYIIQTNSQHVSRSLAANKQLRESVERCKSIAKTPCQRTSFLTMQTDEFDLPQEYRSTQDFVSKFSVAYDSLETSEIISEKALSGRQLLTILGYNFATWFAIAHLIWSIFCWCYDITGHRTNNKVEPRRPIMISSPIQIRPRVKRTLPPLEVNDNRLRNDHASGIKAVHDTHPNVVVPVGQNKINSDD